MSSSLWPHELQHTRLPCPSLSPGVCSNLCPWVSDAFQPCHPLSPPFSSCLQSFLASGFFPMSQLFASGGRSIGASASASVLPKNIQGWFTLGLAGFISLSFKGLSSLLQQHNSKASILWHSAFIVQLAHLYMTTKYIYKYKYIYIYIHIYIYIYMYTALTICFYVLIHPIVSPLLATWRALILFHFWMMYCLTLSPPPVHSYGYFTESEPPLEYCDNG